jgi:GT2 family glycosyltransferase
MLRDVLPAWVRYVHSPPPAADMPYCRAWAFNVGLKHARAPLLVLHDNDILVPERYAQEALRHFAKGYEVINLKRFIFSLTQRHTERVFNGTSGLADVAPLSIGQNLEGGGSLVIARQAYEDVGGLDETFIGWGGEDNEFWERAQTRRHWPYSSMSLIHLWHPAQAGKGDGNNETLKRYYSLAKIDPAERIASLLLRDQGNMAGPWGLRR